MKTIAKNRTKVLDDLFTRGRDFMAYTLGNYFVGQPTTAAWVRRQLAAGLHAKLTERDGHYTVRVHGNEWYEFHV